MKKPFEIRYGHARKDHATHVQRVARQMSALRRLIQHIDSNPVHNKSGLHHTESMLEAHQKELAVLQARIGIK